MNLKSITPFVIFAFSHASAPLDVRAEEGMVAVSRAEITYYCPCKACCGSFKGKIKGQTASGAMAKEGTTLAAPSGIPFGTHIDFKEDGAASFTPIGVVQDRGGAIKASQDLIKIDVYVNDHKKALQLGRRKGWIKFPSSVLNQ